MNTLKLTLIISFVISFPDFSFLLKKEKTIAGKVLTLDCSQAIELTIDIPNTFTGLGENSTSPGSYSCSNYTYDTFSAAVHHLSPPSDGTLVISYVEDLNSNAFDLLIIEGDCDPTNCIAFISGFGAPGGGEITIPVSSGTDYFLVMDSQTNTPCFPPCGSYIITPMFTANNQPCENTDHNALQYFYSETDGDNWTQSTNWQSAPPVNNSWFGVTLSNGCVSELNLPDNDMTGIFPDTLASILNMSDIDFSQNNLSGTIPKALLELPDMTGFDISQNNIDSLPPIVNSNMTLDVSGNRLTFDDILPTINSVASFIYAPQDSINITDTIYAIEGEEVIFDLIIDDTVSSNFYTWDTDSPDPWPTFVIQGINELTITASEGREGDYWSTIMNPNAPGLTLYTTRITLVVNPGCNMQCLTPSVFELDGSGSATLMASELLENNGATCPSGQFELEIFNPGGGSIGSASASQILDCDNVGIPYTYRVTDMMSSEFCEGDLTVEDNLPPNAICLANIPVDIEPGGEVTFFASQINLGSSDNCTSDLFFSFSSNIADSIMVFNCDDIGVVNALMWATDEYNNQSFCPTEITVTDNGGHCNVSPCQGDSLALVALYEATDGDGWNDNTNWLVPGMPIETWHGITLNTDGCVTVIWLSSNGLDGIIPPEIGNLSNLTDLRLFNNFLSGSIPQELGNLNNLSVLGLVQNELSGNIPPELGNLNNLVELWLGENELNGNIPPELGNLNNLVELWLGENELNGNIPPELGNLSNLEKLWLYENELSGSIPQELGNLNGLTHFYLFNNQLEGCFPSELNTFCALWSNPGAPNIPGYKLTNNPALPWGGNMELWCNGEAQIGAPCDDGNPDTDNDMIQSNCTCQGQPVDSCVLNDSLALVALYNVTAGDEWDNNTNWLAPGMPIGTWYGVEVNANGCVICLDLDGDASCTSSGNSGNNLTGPIPEELGSLSDLEFLYLDNNQLNGNIPPELGNLSNLEILYLDFNHLSGNIPAELGNISLLSSLYLSNNMLDSVIPPELGNLSNLGFLHLDNNQLTGNIPPELGNISLLRSLYLSNNMLSGNIPEELGGLSNLWNLMLSSNMLEGSIPPELGNLISNIRFFLNDNNLEGCYPPELQSRCNLGFSSDPSDFGYNLTNNPLLPWQGDFQMFCNNEPQTGAPCDDGNPDTENDIIQPDCSCQGTPINNCVFDDSTALVALYEATNGDEWNNSINWLVPGQPIDTWFGVTVNGDGCVEVIWLHSNGLNGSLPAELGNLSNLTDLRLFNNFLSGSIPPELGNLSNLTVLGLSQNQLSGNIPQELGNLSDLTILWLNDNQLNGNIPTVLGNLNNLVELWLGENELNGNIPPELGNLSNLEKLWLYENELSGSIPEELGNLNSLMELGIFDNQLSGNIPAELGNLNLTLFYLYNNQLEGCFPNELNVFCDLYHTPVNPDIFPNISGYSLINNPALPWNGNMEMWCNGEAQIGAPCDDGNPDTVNDMIQPDCSCLGCPTNITGDETYEGCSGDGYSVTVNGSIYNENNPSGEEIIPAFNGCDSVVNIFLEFIPLDTTYILGPLCEGGSITVNGVVYDELNPSGVQTIPDLSNVLCDSVIIIDLAFNSVVSFDLDTTLCPGGSLEVNGIIFDETSPNGPAIFPNGSYLGCDSIVNVNLNFFSPASSNFDTLICENDTIEIDGIQFHQGHPTDTVFFPGMSYYECDSMKIINVDFLSTSIINRTDTLCFGDSLEVNNAIYHQGHAMGTEIIPGGNYLGCDSIIEVNLSFLDEAVGEYMGTFCHDTTITICEIPFDTSFMGTVVCEGGSWQGCDSTIYVELEFVENFVDSITGSLCEGESIFINHTEYNCINNSGIDSLTSLHGCDSIVHIYFTCLPHSSDTLSGSFCPGDTLWVNGTAYHCGNYSGIETLTNYHGCDSVVVINYDSCPPPAMEDLEISFSCPDETIIINGTEYGENNIEGTEIIAGGNYLGCDSIIRISVTYELPDEEMPNVFTPNGDGINDTFNPVAVLEKNDCVTIPSGAAELTILNRWGDAIFRATAPADIIWDGTNGSDDVVLPEGTYYYFLTVKSVEGEKEIRGAINLLKGE